MEIIANNDSHLGKEVKDTDTRLLLTQKGFGLVGLVGEMSVSQSKLREVLY